YSANVVETRGSAEIFRRVAEGPGIALPRNLEEYDSDAVRSCYERLRDLRAIGRDYGATLRGMLFEGRMLKAMLQSANLALLPKLIDHLTFLFAGDAKIRLSARDASLFLNIAKNLALAI